MRNYRKALKNEITCEMCNGHFVDNISFCLRCGLDPVHAYKVSKDSTCDWAYVVTECENCGGLFDFTGDLSRKKQCISCKVRTTCKN